MPIVPFSVLADPPFAVIKDRDAARAIVAAAREGLAEPVNVVASGADHLPAGDCVAGVGCRSR